MNEIQVRQFNTGRSEFLKEGDVARRRLYCNRFDAVLNTVHGGKLPETTQALQDVVSAKSAV
jgi:hypothetical protein